MERDRSVVRIDLAILHEVVRVVQARAKVPERVRLQKREYHVTYLDDHRQRIEEALRRHDVDRLNMLFGQLASKVKYQLLRKLTVPAKGRLQVSKRRPQASKVRPQASKARSQASKVRPQASKARAPSRAAQRSSVRSRPTKRARSR